MKVKSSFDKVKSNNKHSSKLSFKRNECIRLRLDIREYLKKQLGVNLPNTYREFKALKSAVMLYDEYDHELENEWIQVVKLYYKLGACNKAFYGKFTNEKAIDKLQVLSCFYSKHRIDPVWCYRKMQLIRNIYYNYLKSSNIHREYKPIHLVLTVPRDKKGFWQGKEFYAKELMTAFNLMRKSSGWKKYIYAGEYGVEVKKSKGAGLHIHIHSLIFQNPEFDVHEVREWIDKEWRKQTGNNSKYSGIHYETLFFYKKDSEGNYIKETKRRHDKIDKAYYMREVKKKFYLDQSSTDEEYMTGIMECIKYHFKNDCFRYEWNEDIQDYNTGLNETYEYNINLIKEVLNNTTGMRLYSRFGEFYKVKELCFNNLTQEAPALSEAEMEEETMNGNSDKSIENLINPHTLEPALPHEFSIVMSLPETIRHQKLNNYEPEIITPSYVFQIDSRYNLKAAIKLLAKNELRALLTVHEYARYETLCMKL